MQLRPATRTEIREIAELWTHTFPDGPTLADRVRTLEEAGAAGGIETVTVAIDDDRIAGALKSLKFTQHIGGAALPMFGLAAVGVAPWARRRGVARILCEHALHESFERRDAVSALYPFRPAFYRRMGWALTGELHRYRFPPERLADPGDPAVRLATASDLPAVEECYAHVAERSNGLIDRDSIRWDHHLDKAGTHVFAASTGDTVDGYMIVRYGRSRSGETRPLAVREIVTADAAAYARLLAFISRQRDLWRRVRYDASPDERFGHRLTDPRPPGYATARGLWAETARVLRGPMFRIVNVERAFSLRTSWGPAPAFEFSLAVDDAQLPGNAGPWSIAFDGQAASIRPADRAAAASPASHTRLAVDAPALAQLFAGELAPSAAERLGTATIEGDTAALDAFFRNTASFRLLDEF
jgi:predicted acetyltransferase